MKNNGTFENSDGYSPEVSPVFPSEKSIKNLKKIDKLFRYPDRDFNLEKGEILLKEDRYQNLDELLRRQEETKDSRLPEKLRQIAQNACENIDAIIQQKRDAEKNAALLMRQMIDGEVDKELEEGD